MNAKDLQRRVGLQMKQMGSTPSLEPLSQQLKEKAIADFDEAILDYTSDKLSEAGNKDDLISDLGFMFDILDTYFQSEKEKENFYQEYVFAMLNIHNNLEQDSLLWSPVEEPEEGITYPRFTAVGAYLNFFETIQGESNKETALWFHSNLTTRYKNEKSYTKK